MCTAISKNFNSHLFGRTLDIERSYSESVVITPRKFRFEFIREAPCASHPALIGMACVRDGVPLYYDAMNESGLAAAGLNFPVSNVYHTAQSDKRNIASFELIPWVLCQCKSAEEAAILLSETNITPDSFSPDLPATPLHWIIADKDSSITVESVGSGLMVYPNCFGVLTNEPPFPFHRANIGNYLRIGSGAIMNELCPSVDIKPVSRGTAAFGLPGDFSSPSRFLRALFLSHHTVTEKKEHNISAFFHILDGVSIPRGCVRTEDGENMSTVYACCADTEELIYYFITQDCRRIRAVGMRDGRLDGDELAAFPIYGGEDVLILKNSTAQG